MSMSELLITGANLSVVGRGMHPLRLASERSLASVERQHDFRGGGDHRWPLVSFAVLMPLSGALAKRQAPGGVGAGAAAAR